MTPAYGPACTKPCTSLSPSSPCPTGCCGLGPLLACTSPVSPCAPAWTISHVQTSPTYVSHRTIASANKTPAPPKITMPALSSPPQACSRPLSARQSRPSTVRPPVSRPLLPQRASLLAAMGRVLLWPYKWPLGSTEEGLVFLFPEHKRGWQFFFRREKG